MHDIRSSLVRGERRDPLASKAAGVRRGGASLAAIKVRREESRRCDQRREGRHLGVVDRAMITYQRRSHEVAVLNVSSRGTMIASELAPRIGARIDIRFAECERTECFVRWVRDGRIGLEFGKETLVIAPAEVRDMIVGGRRAGEQPTVTVKGERAPRQTLILRGELHWPLGSMAVKLRNISAEGAMLQGSQDLDPGTEIVLDIPGASALPGRVRWCRSNQIGVRFDSRLDLASLAREEAAPKQVPGMMTPDYLKSETDPASPWAARWERLSPDDL